MFPGRKVLIFHRCRVPDRSTFFVLSFHVKVVGVEDTLANVSNTARKMNEQKGYDWVFDTQVYGNLQRFGIAGSTKHVPAIARGDTSIPDFWNPRPARMMYLCLEPDTELYLPSISDSLIQTGRIVKNFCPKLIPVTAEIPYQSHKDADDNFSAAVKKACISELSNSLLLSLHSDRTEDIKISELTYVKIRSIYNIVVGTTLRECPYGKRTHESPRNTLFICINSSFRGMGSIPRAHAYLSCLRCFRDIPMDSRIRLSSANGLNKNFTDALCWKKPIDTVKTSSRKRKIKT